MNQSRIKSVIIPSKVCLAPINTGFSDNGLPTDEFYSFHSLRSSRYIGICCVGNISISDEFASNKSTLSINDKNINAFKDLTDKIKSNGSVAGIQLACRFSNIPAMKGWASPSAYEYIKQSSEEISNMPVSKIIEIRDKFLYACELAAKAGFTHIQLHAAHGYFLSKMISNNFNKRKDEYSDTLRIIKEISCGVASNFPEMILDIRISLFEKKWFDEEDILYKKKIIHELTQMPFDIISLSNGIYNIDKHMIYPQKELGSQQFFYWGNYFSEKYPDTFWNVAGNFDSLDDMEINYKDNLLFSVGRQLICDPDYIEKHLAGNSTNIQYCKRCGNCHYYSNDMDNIKSCSRKAI